MGGWVFKSTLHQLYPLQRGPVVIVHEAGWAPRLVWTGVENLAPQRDSIPGSSSPYQVAIPLRYPDPRYSLSTAIKPRTYSIQSKRYIAHSNTRKRKIKLRSRERQRFHRLWGAFALYTSRALLPSQLPESRPFKTPVSHQIAAGTGSRGGNAEDNRMNNLQLLYMKGLKPLYSNGGEKSYKFHTDCWNSHTSDQIKGLTVQAAVPVLWEPNMSRSW
jgi:hypothetical protein